MGMFGSMKTAVSSTDNLMLVTGNADQQSADSVVMFAGFSGSKTFGTIRSGSIEDSDGDLAAELMEMIEAQRIHSANSNVLQTGSDLMDVLVNLKR